MLGLGKLAQTYNYEIQVFTDETIDDLVRDLQAVLNRLHEHKI